MLGEQQHDMNNAGHTATDGVKKCEGLVIAIFGQHRSDERYAEKFIKKKKKKNYLFLVSQAQTKVGGLQSLDQSVWSTP